MKLRFIRSVKDVRITSTQLINGRLEVVYSGGSYEAGVYIHVQSITNNGDGTSDINVDGANVISALATDSFEQHGDGPGQDRFPTKCCNER